MGGYRSTEYDSDSSDTGDTNNPDRAQTTLESIQSSSDGGSMQDLSDDESAAVNDISVEGDVDDESLENIKNEIAADVSRGNMDVDDVENISIESTDEESISTDVQAWTDEEGEIYDDGERTIVVGGANSGQVTQSEARRLATRTRNLSQNTIHSDNADVLRSRSSVESTPADEQHEQAWEMDKSGRLMVNGSEEGTAANEYNEFWSESHDNQRVICGARDDSARFSTDAENTMASMEDELESGKFSAGTNEWQYGADAIHASIEENGVEPSQEWKEYIDTMSIASGKTDSVRDSPWGSGETVFGEVTEENYDEGVENVRGRMHQNSFSGAGTSRNISQDIKETKSD